MHLKSIIIDASPLLATGVSRRTKERVEAVGTLDVANTGGALVWKCLR